MGKHKRKKNYYFNSAKRQKQQHNHVLRSGMKGFLCTCNFHERDCVRETYNLLNQFADRLYGPEQLKKAEASQEDKNTDQDTDQQGGEMERVTMGTKAGEQQEQTSKGNAASGNEDDDDDDEVDIDAALKADIEELQKKQKSRQERPEKRFQQVECGANNCIFIKTTLSDPLALSMAIMDHILQTQEQCTKRLLRLLPVQATCRAFPEDIEKAAKVLAEEFFRKDGSGGKSFYITFKSRNNSSVERESVTLALVKVLQDAHPNNTPDMVTPDVVVSVEVVKGVCCLSILPGYLTKYAKYNLLTLATKAKAAQQQQEGQKENNGKVNDGMEENGVSEQPERRQLEEGLENKNGVLEKKAKDKALSQNESGMQREDCHVEAECKEEAKKSQERGKESQGETDKG